MKRFVAIVALVALVSIGISSADNYVNTPGIDNNAFFGRFDEHMAHLAQYEAALNKYTGTNQITAVIGGKTYRFGVFPDGWHFDAFTEMIP